MINNIKNTVKNRLACEEFPPTCFIILSKPPYCTKITARKSSLSSFYHKQAIRILIVLLVSSSFPIQPRQLLERSKTCTTSVFSPSQPGKMVE
jgi:hypothetical protein